MSFGSNHEMHLFMKGNQSPLQACADEDIQEGFSLFHERLIILDVVTGPRPLGAAR